MYGVFARPNRSDCFQEVFSVRFSISRPSEVDAYILVSGRFQEVLFRVPTARRELLRNTVENRNSKKRLSRLPPFYRVQLTKLDFCSVVFSKDLEISTCSCSHV